MSKILFLLALMSLSFHSFAAAFDILCTNNKGDVVEALVTITGERDSNGTWDYIRSDVDVIFTIKGKSGAINKDTLMILTKTGWNLQVFNISHGYSETVELESKNQKITARFTNPNSDVRLSCQELKH